MNAYKPEALVAVSKTVQKADRVLVVDKGRRRVLFGHFGHHVYELYRACDYRKLGSVVGVRNLMFPHKTY